MVEGPDKAVYVGTLPSAHIMRLDWQSHQLVDLGTPSPGESYIWALTVGSDGKLYGGTSPHAKLISFDPRTRESQDLGRMSENQDYARYVAADNGGLVYIRIGVGTGLDLVAYDIASGQHFSILPANEAHPSEITLGRGADGAVYAQIAKEWFGLSGRKAIPSSPPRLETEDLGNGLHVSFEGSRLRGRGADGKVVEYAGNYQGEQQEIFHLAAGPDGRVYASTRMPFHLFWAASQGTDAGDLGEIGQGDAYSMLAWHNRLIGAAYAAGAPLFIYRPDQPWQPGPTANDNPWLIHYAGENATWRPMAMVAGPQDKVFIAGLPGYGLLGGSLCVLDPSNGKVDQYSDLVNDQSIVALTTLSDGLVVGGTSIYGGTGSHPTQREATLFIWNPRLSEKVFQTVPVPGQPTVAALSASPNGMVYGFAGKMMFEFDPARKEVARLVVSGIGEVLPNALGLGPDGALYGLTHQGIFRIAGSKSRPVMIATYPAGIDRGFAIIGHQLFFASKSRMVSYRLPDY